MKGDGDGNYDDSREVSKQFKIYFKSIEHYDKKKKKDWESSKQDTSPKKMYRDK